MALAVALISNLALADDARRQEETQRPESPSQPAAPVGLSTLLAKARALARQTAPAPGGPAPAARTARDVSSEEAHPLAPAAASQSPPATQAAVEARYGHAPAPVAVAYADAAQQHAVVVEPAPAETAPRASPPPQADASPARTWQVDAEDKSIKRALLRWSSAAGWQLVWELPVDYPIEAHAAFAGSFEQAVAAVAVSMEHAEMPIKAIFYRGNKVLRIVAKGAQ